MIACIRRTICFLFLQGSIFVCFVPKVHCQDKDPLQLAERVANKIIKDTRFEFNLIPQTEQVGMQIIDFRFLKMKAEEAAYAMRFARSLSDTSVRFGITSPCSIKIWLNKKLVYTQQAHKATIPLEYSYDRFKFKDYFSVNLSKGENQFLIELASGKGPQVVFLRPVTYTGDLDLSIQFKINSQPATWMYAGPFTSGTTISPEIDATPYYKSNDTYRNWQSPPQPFLPELIVPKSSVYQKGSYADWQYANGAMIWSLLNLSDVTHDTKYLTFTEAYTGFIISHLGYFRWQYDSLFAFRGSYHRIFRLTMLDDAGAPALPFTSLYIKNQDTVLRKITDSVIDYVFKRQVRLEDGTFCRPEPVEYTVWADDLFMSVPLLLQSAIITGKQQYYDDAANQTIHFKKYLFDKETGLYRHGWFSNTGKQSPVSWGRANGWIAWATAELLEELPKKHPLYKTIERNFQEQMKSLVRYQAADGMWRQVLNNPNSFEETSCTAMFTLAMARGIRNGWLSKKYKEYAIKGWNAIADHITAEGVVHGICRGTEIGTNMQFYVDRQTIDNDPRGLGAVITAGIEISKLN